MASLPTILIVDDDPQIRRLLTETLSLEGYPFESATNGREGLDALARASGPRIVLLDLLMPEVTGKEFMLELRQRPAERARHKIIFMSANHVLEPHLYLEPDATLAKPFTVNQLLNLLQGVQVPT
jgi:CheY-like chemotaxis protein